MYCKKCKGTGEIHKGTDTPDAYYETCQKCEGSGFSLFFKHIEDTCLIIFGIAVLEQNLKLKSGEVAIGIYLMALIIQTLLKRKSELNS